jgi:hypothetical protein
VRIVFPRPYMQDAPSAPNPLIINIIQVSVLNQVSRHLSSYPTNMAHSILYTCLYQSQLRYIYMLFENRNCLYKKSDILLRSVCLIFARNVEKSFLVWQKGEGLILVCLAHGSVGDTRSKLHLNQYVRSREVLLATLIVACLVKKLPDAL